MTVTDFKQFKDMLGYRESSGNYNRDLGEYWGKYQFGPARRLDISRALNIQTPTREQFTPALQDMFFKKHIELYEQELKPLNIYLGKVITGKKNNITAEANEFGLIAGAHLGGATGLKSFLTKGIDKKDSLGTYISDYVAMFSLKMEQKKKKKR